MSTQFSNDTQVLFLAVLVFPLFFFKTDFISIWADVVLSTDTVIVQSLGQNIRAHSILQRKRENVNRKYTQPARPRRQLSPGFLEDALDEVDSLLFSCFFSCQLDSIVIISYCHMHINYCCNFHSC